MRYRKPVRTFSDYMSYKMRLYSARKKMTDAELEVFKGEEKSIFDSIFRKGYTKKETASIMRVDTELKILVTNIIKHPDDCEDKEAIADKMEKVLLNNIDNGQIADYKIKYQTDEYHKAIRYTVEVLPTKKAKGWYELLYRLLMTDKAIKSEE